MDRQPYSSEPPSYLRPVRPESDDSSDAPGELDLWKLVLHAWNAKWLIVAGTGVTALVAFAISLMLPKTYEAMATVFITASTFRSELTPPPFSVEAYARLAESDYVRAQVTARLQKEGVADQSLGRLSARLFPSREPQKPYLPLMGLTVEASEARQAQRVANAWAAVFVEEQTKMAALGKSGSVDFILAEYPKASTRLLEQERALKSIEDSHAKLHADARGRAAINLKKEQLTSREATIVQFEAELYKARVARRESNDRLAQLEKELARTDRVVTVSKAITDDALWQAVTTGGAGKPGTAPASLAASRLRTEEINPVYTHLSQALAEQRVNNIGLAAREDMLARQVVTIKADAAVLRADLATSERILADLDRKLKMDAAPATRAVDEARARFKKLDEKIGEAQIAKAEQDRDVKIGALAELPSGPSGPNPMRNATLAALIGLALSLVASWVLVHVRRSEPDRVAQVSERARLTV